MSVNETKNRTIASVLSSAKWLSIANFLKLIIQTVGLVFLSRLLAPADFGLMAMATILTNLAGLFRDMGTGAAIVQRKVIDELILRTVFTFNVFIGACIFIILIVLAPVVESVFSAKGLSLILMVVACVFPITSYGAVHQANLERNSKFKLLAALELGSYSIGLIVAVVAAALGAGVFSLALQAVVNAILLTFGLCFVSDWKPKITRDMSKLYDLFGFTGPLTAYHLSNYFIKNVDQFLVGVLLGSVNLGVYSFATKITTYPQQLTSLAAGRALAPKLSTLQDNPSELISFSLRTLGFMAFVCGPIIFGMMALREDFVSIAFGSQWGEVPPVLVFLLPAALLNSIASVFVAIYIACGRVKLLFGWGLFLGGVLAVLVYAGTSWGLVGAAAAILLSALVAFFLMLSGLHWLPKLTLFSVATTCVIPLLNSIVLYSITRFADGLILSFGISALLSMLFAAAIGCLAYLLIAIRFDINNMVTLRRLLGLSSSSS